ncbi:ankyrin repeat domain-containing protein [Marinicella marina]|uniref:ankyrin repeat domain-containing protein n=1 Tax=Marinicella marina TaxID=2996016 RepID=UPI0024BCE1E9|nr:ankyrin repeat domain-containing protein [Marinicella marina]MDJ1138799.1 ankyrin repeat domain-containing protein [Marinicella marina]
MKTSVMIKIMSMVSIALCLLCSTVHSQNTDNDSDLNTYEFLKYAASGDLNSVQNSLASGVDINARDRVFLATALHNASSQGHVHVVDWLISHGANIEQQDYQGATALIWSAYNGKFRPLISLLKAGANPNHIPQQGPTALIAATQSGDIKAVNALLEYEADVSVTSTDGVTPIDAATLRNDQSILSVLNNIGDKK